jgi:hypothetical protein
MFNILWAAKTDNTAQAVAETGRGLCLLSLVYDERATFGRSLSWRLAGVGLINEDGLIGSSSSMKLTAEQLAAILAAAN